MPVIGMMPIVMPMFSKIWNTNMHSTPDAHQRAEQVSRRGRRPPDPPHDEPEQTDQEAGADQPELLADDGEDEVGRLLGHIGEVRLRALEQPLPGDPARPDRDLGLVEVVLRRVHVEYATRWALSLLIEEGAEAIELVLLEHAELQHQHDGGDAERGEEREVARVGPADREHAEQDRR